MSRAAHGVIKGIVVAITFVGAVFMFQQTIPISIEAVKNWRILITGRYLIQPVSDTIFYSFNGYAFFAAMAMNMIPSKDEIISSN